MRGGAKKKRTVGRNLRQKKSWQGKAQSGEKKKKFERNKGSKGPLLKARSARERGRERGGTAHIGSLPKCPEPGNHRILGISPLTEECK